MFGIPTKAVPVVALVAAVLAMFILVGFYKSKIATFIGAVVLVLTILVIKQAGLGHDQLVLTAILVDVGGAAGSLCGFCLIILRGHRSTK